MFIAASQALHGSDLEKVVLESTLGAQPGERCGDLNVLYDFEQALAAQPIPAAGQRAAYYAGDRTGLRGDVRKVWSRARPLDALEPKSNASLAGGYRPKKGIPRMFRDE